MNFLSKSEDGYSKNNFSEAYNEAIRACDAMYDEVIHEHKLEDAEVDCVARPMTADLFSRYTAYTQMGMKCNMSNVAHTLSQVLTSNSKAVKSVEPTEVTIDAERLCIELVKRGLRDPRLNSVYPNVSYSYSVKWHDTGYDQITEWAPSSLQKQRAESQLLYRMSDGERKFVKRANTSLGISHCSKGLVEPYGYNKPQGNEDSDIDFNDSASSDGDFAQNLQLINGPPGRALSSQYMGRFSPIPPFLNTTMRQLESRSTATGSGTTRWKLII